MGLDAVCYIHPKDSESFYRHAVSASRVGFATSWAMHEFKGDFTAHVIYSL